MAAVMRWLARALFALAWAGAAAVAPAAVSAVDDDGRVVTLAAPARRIVSLAPHATELLFALDAGARVVGASAASDWPPEARSLPRVGDARAIDLERIVALAPDLVVTWPYTAPAQVARLRARGVPVFVLDARSLDVLPSQIARLGRLLGDAGRAEALAAARAAQLEALRARYRGAPRVVVFYEVWHTPLYTIGGGHLEFKALHIARDMLTSGKQGTHLERFSLGASLGQCCGGVTVLLFEPMGQVQAQIAVFGAGHVGRALVPLLASLPCRVRWIDSREQEFPALIPAGVRKIVAEEPLDEIDHLPAGSYCIVMTHNHQLDLELTAALLKRNDFTYFGLIGSKTKRVKFEHRLRERGFDTSTLQRMRCPMGIGEVKGKLPVEIAISIAGEIIATYNAHFGQHTASAEPIAQLLPASRRSQAI